jgi:peptidoglycan hydrolase-like protein with peptidoglycan-binding domain
MMAHAWYNLAAASGHRHAASARDTVSGRMTSEQVAEAQRQARAWQPTSATLPPATAAPPAQPLAARDLLAAIQGELNRRGYDAGPVDGLMGTRTRNAIRAYQGHAGLTADGQPSASLLAHLRQETSAPVATTPPPSTTDTPLAPAFPHGFARERVVLEDDFSDGDFRRNPSWTVLNGQFRVDSGGLRSVVERPRVSPPVATEPGSNRREDLEIGFALLQIILDQASGRGPVAASAPAATTPEAARIIVPAAVGKAFEIDLELISHGPFGSLEWGLYPGDQPDDGYRLVFSATEPRLSLMRLTGHHAEVVASNRDPIDLEVGRTHSLNWARNRDGVMQVRLDGRRVIQTQDRQPMNLQGFLWINHGGDYNLRRIRIEG